MSTPDVTTTPAVVGSVEPSGDSEGSGTPPRTRSKRLRLFAPAFGVVAVIGYSSMSGVWYNAYLPPTTVMGVSGVHASTQLTGNGLVALGIRTATQGMSLTSVSPQISSTHGLLTPVVWVLGAAVLGILGSLFGSILGSLASLFTTLYAWQTLIVLRGQIEQPRTWGGFTVLRGPGQQRLWLALTLMVTFAALCTAQTMLVRHHTKRLERELHPEKARSGGLMGLMNGGILGAMLFGMADNRNAGDQITNGDFAETGTKA